ncbi:MAG: 5-deoxy-glucuronate isomerase [Actinobacteria bacterium]|nr:5-deoxy-glucuronate isomerase [Actinomycetota bacterium]
MSQWVHPAGTTADADFDTRVLPGDPGWAHTGLQVTDLAAGESRTVETGELEYIVVPLSGGATVEVAGESHRLAGRSDVFTAATDVLYVPRGASFTLTSTTGGRYALCSATAREALPVSYLPAASVPDELRGAGTASRRVRNFGTPGVLAADSIIACEVITPAGNWSSYPPHKHDEEREGVETSLEEIYYFELRTEPGAPGAGNAFGYQRVYGTDERPIDVLAEVRSGDVVLVPHGWHGPAMAPPGYDMYYLNVMAGPGATRAWLICDDPTHAWVRQTWAGQAVDPRLTTTE